MKATAAAKLAGALVAAPFALALAELLDRAPRRVALAALERELAATRRREGAAVRALQDERARCDDYAENARRYHREREEAREALRVEQLRAGQASREAVGLRNDLTREQAAHVATRWQFEEARSENVVLRARLDRGQA